jgi:hypothetical protein
MSDGTESRREIAERLVATGFPWDWDGEKTPPAWLLDELAAAWHRKDRAHDETIEDYAMMLERESMAFAERVVE